MDSLTRWYCMEYIYYTERPAEIVDKDGNNLSLKGEIGVNRKCVSETERRHTLYSMQLVRDDGLATILFDSTLLIFARKS